MTLLNQKYDEYDPLAYFTYGLKAAESRRQYPRRLKVFLDFLKLDGSLDEQAKCFWLKARSDPRWTEDKLIHFIITQKERVESGEISASTVPNYYKAAKLFCDMNEIVLNWKKIAKGLPRARDAANDRAPTQDEILKLIEYPDRRIKSIVSIMVSSGIRIGAFDYLRWKHIVPIHNKHGKIEVAKMVVYAGENEEYYSFLTPEAYSAVKDWMDFRAFYGEEITGDSWVMRDIWQTSNVTYGANLGLATCPKKLKSSGIRRIIERALWEQGLRKPLTNGNRRHEWKAAHGFRKFFKTRAEQVMKPINVEITMGHNVGVSASYYKPTDTEVMEDYLKAVNSLTIYNTGLKLEKQVKELTRKSKHNEQIVKSKLFDREVEVQTLKEQNRINSEAIASISDRLIQMSKDLEIITASVH